MALICICCNQLNIKNSECTFIQKRSLKIRLERQTAAANAVATDFQGQHRNQFRLFVLTLLDPVSNARQNSQKANWQINHTIAHGAETAGSKSSNLFSPISYFCHKKDEHGCERVSVDAPDSDQRNRTVKACGGFSVTFELHMDYFTVQKDQTQQNKHHKNITFVNFTAPATSPFSHLIWKETRHGFVLWENFHPDGR